MLQDICSIVGQLSVSNQPPVKLNSLGATLQDIRSRVGQLSAAGQTRKFRRQDICSRVGQLSATGIIEQFRGCVTGYML